MCLGFFPIFIIGLFSSSLTLASLVIDFDLDTFPAPKVTPIALNRAAKYDCQTLLIRSVESLIPYSAQGLSLQEGAQKRYPRRTSFGKKGMTYPSELWMSIRSPAKRDQAADKISQGSPLSKAEVLRRMDLAKTPMGTIALSALLPDPLRKELNQGRYWGNENCFNTALRFWDSEEAPSETYDYEMVQDLSKKFRTLQPGEPPRFGDLVIFWSAGPRMGSQYAIQHAAIYLDEGWILQKGTRANADPITFQKIEPIFNYYLDLKGPLVLTLHRKKGK